MGYGGWLVLRLRLTPAPGKGEFRSVSFSYVPDREVRKGLNLRLQPGKTATADLLLKLFKPTKGEILIDGNSIVEAGPAAVRPAIGGVATVGAVFRGTLAGNIRYKRPTANLDYSTELEVKQALFNLNPRPPLLHAQGSRLRLHPPRRPSHRRRHARPTPGRQRLVNPARQTIGNRSIVLIQSPLQRATMRGGKRIWRTQ